MKIKITLSRTNETKEIEMQTGSTVNELLKKINLKPDTIIVMNKDKPIPIDTKINNDEEFMIIQVSSGG